MAQEPNGRGDSSRLDRIERAIEGLVAGQERLLSSQKQLLTAQVVMTDTVATLASRERSPATHDAQIKVLRESRRRVDETCAYIKKLLLERFPGGRP